ncbi:MAG: DUF2163 domain-containing protein [Maritimibacter sp.]
MGVSAEFQAHLDSGNTTLARCWALTRRDGMVLGFTDHDRDLSFDGISFKAETGLTARALAQSTGLSIDNSEALGGLSSAAVTEADITAGRYDGAEVRVNLNDPAFAGEGMVAAIDGKSLRISGMESYAGGWFARGRLLALSGAAQGLSAPVKSDRLSGGIHNIELWGELRAALAPGDAVRLEAGCDKGFATCRDKFANQLNFRGFPHVPGEDRLLSIPVPVPEGGGESGGGK